MLKRNHLQAIFVLLLLMSCHELKLFNKNIYFPLPSHLEMQHAYENNKSYYDSIASFSFSIIDMKQLGPVNQVTICDKNNNLSAPADSMCCDLISISNLLDKDSLFNELKNKILFYKKKIRIPECIDIFRNRVQIPYKKIRETIKGDTYKSFIYVRNAAPVEGDSISYNVFTN